MFLKAYANVPADERGEIIVVINNIPYSWNRAYDEASKDTELGKKIIHKMIELGFLPRGEKNDK